MDVEIKRQPQGLVDITLHDPPGPSLVMYSLTDRDVCDMARQIYEQALESEDWAAPVPITFVDMGGRANTHTAVAGLWRQIVISMLKSVSADAVLETITPAGSA